MAKEPSFDVVSEVDMQEVSNAVNQTVKEITQRFDFKGSKSVVEIENGNAIKIVTEDGSAEGLGFAIPSQRVKYVADRLIAGEEVKAGVFGFSVNTHALVGGGLELVKVEEESDAWAKGLRKGDIIIAANGQPVTSTQDLIRLKMSLGPGDIVTLLCMRDGESFLVDVALIER